MMSAAAIDEELTVCDNTAPAQGEGSCFSSTAIGGTPLLELHGMDDAAARASALTKRDAILKTLWDAPIHTPAMRWGRQASPDAGISQAVSLST